ncbi:MAG: hypothetical protein HY703_02465 [Gemmatimonadetes bacterium]|nr:hypothetical protein [Gemmatimonadota bacterium]
MALGRALTALSSADAVFANPAGLADLDSGQFVVHHGTTILLADANAFSLLFTPRLIGTLGVSYQLIDWGVDPALDDQGFPTGEISTREHLLVASFATGIGTGFSGGLNYKLYQFRIDCRGSCSGRDGVGTTHGIDFGLQYRPGWVKGLQLGASVTNLGFALQVVNALQADPLPARLHLGAAYEVLRHIRPDSTLALWAVLEVEDRLREPGSPVGSLAFELMAGQVVALRVGYRGGEGLETGPAVGLGLKHKRFDLAVAKSFAASPLDPDREPFQVTFGIRF